MGPLIGIGFAAFFVVALVVGARVLLLARRTRELPELLMGIGVLGIGPVGFGLLVIGQQLQTSHPLVFQILVGTASVAISSGVLAKLIFNWRVYHPTSAAVRALVISGGLLLFGLVLYSGVAFGFTDAGPLTPQALIRSWLQVGCLLWGAGESFAYWLKMRRRIRIGLADPVIANRFLMWAIGAFAAGWGTAVGIVGQMVTGVEMLRSPWIMASSSLHGLVAAIAIALAFIPPSSYLRYIRSRADPEASRSA